MKSSFSDRVALVTGSTAGLGKSIALCLGKAGARVVVNYCHNSERARETFQEIRAAAVEAVLVQADITNENEVERLFSEAAAALGEIDILVVNATPRHVPRPVEDYCWGDYQSLVDFFIKSPFLLARRALPFMKRQRWGRIINVSSDVYHQSSAYFSAYAAAKSAQIGWGRSLARELGRFGITVNTVAPGWIPTERQGVITPEEEDRHLARVPAGRWGTPADVAHAVLYFASEESSFASGQTLCVNGGLTPW